MVLFAVILRLPFSKEDLMVFKGDGNDDLIFSLLIFYKFNVFNTVVSKSCL